MEIFRRNNVRFIAVNNGIDSEKPDTLEFAPFIGLYPKASLFIFACGRNFSLKIIRLGGDFIRKLLVYFRLRPDFRPENGRINRNEKLIFNS